MTNVNGPMNQEVKAEWVKRLRSGKYSQAKDALAPKDGFCCLGVLCEIAADEGIVERETDSHGMTLYVDSERGSVATHIPINAVTIWSGLFDWGFTHEDKYDTLTGMNDNGATFDEIADTIEREF